MRSQELAAIDGVLALVAVIGVISAVSPGVEPALSIAFVALLAAAALGVAVWFGARWVRERREDREDAIAARAARAAYIRGGVR